MTPGCCYRITRGGAFFYQRGYFKFSAVCNVINLWLIYLLEWGFFYLCLTIYYLYKCLVCKWAVLCCIIFHMYSLKCFTCMCRHICILRIIPKLVVYQCKSHFTSFYNAIGNTRCIKTCTMLQYWAFSAI